MKSQAVIQSFIEALEFETGILLRADEVQVTESDGNARVSVFGQEVAVTELEESDEDTAQALFEEIPNPRVTVAEAKMTLLEPALESAKELLMTVVEDCGILEQMDFVPVPELGVWDGMGFHWETDTETSSGWPHIGLIMENAAEDFDFRFAFNIYAPEEAFDPDELEAELRAYCADWMD